MRVTRTEKTIHTPIENDRRYRDISARRRARTTEQHTEALTRRNGRSTHGTTRKADQKIEGTQTHYNQNARFTDQPRPDNTFRCNSAFLAHLIGIKENAAHLREHRRVEPQEGVTSYLTTQRAPRQIGEGRIFEYNA